MNKREEQPSCWGSLEELLLACAVNRHGADSWDSVSAELRRLSSDHRYHYSPTNCRRRYSDLRRRFAGDDVVAELKRLRVEELRREVEKHDVSIEILQLKLRKLEEERQETDLSTEPEIKKPAGVSQAESLSGDRSLNESNSTANLKDEPESKQVKPESKLVKPEEPEPPGLALKLTDERGGDSVDESKKSGESRKNGVHRGRLEIRGSSGEDEPDADEVPLAAKQISIKCQPLIKILAILRAHKSGSVFERRFRSQESEKYKMMIRRHIDLRTIQRRLEKGFYLHSRRKFFRDLLLLCTNALIFFPSNSKEYSAASELRKLVAAQMAKTIPKPEPNKKRPERAPSPPIVVCRRRSSINLKPAPSSVAVVKNIKKAEVKPKIKNPKFDATARDRVIVKKPGVKEKNSKSNNPKKPLLKELDSSSSSSSSSDGTEDDDEQMGRGRIMKDDATGRRGGGRREKGGGARNCKLGKRGRPGRGSPPVVTGGRGGKRGKGSGGTVEAAAEDMGRMRKRPRR